jgi:hypothetical protein
VPGTGEYRALLFDQGGQVIYEVELADTIAPLPDSVSLVPGRQYLWKVEARIDWDHWSSSELVRFSVPSGQVP